MVAAQRPATTRPPLAHARVPSLGSVTLLVPEVVPEARATEGSRPANVLDSRSRRPDLRLRLFVIDLVGSSIAWMGVSLVHPDGIGVGPRLAGAGAATAVTLVVVAVAGLYRARVCALKSSQGLGIVWACIAGAVAFVVMRRSIGAGGALTAAITGAVVCFVLLGVLRWQFDRWLRACRSDGRFVRPVVLVGANADAEELWTIVSRQPELGYKVECVVSTGTDSASWEDVRVVEGIDRVPDVARRAGANGVLVVTSALTSRETRQVLREAMAAGLHVQLWPGLSGIGSRRLRSVPISREASFYVEVPSASPWHGALKRAIDLIGSALALLISSPFLIVAGGLIKLHDRGPILLRQERVGRDGHTFTLLKLRTMVPDAEYRLAELRQLNERTDGPLFKVRTDPRVTPIGRFLRATSVDELPQLLNVLAGTMSLVGPRPALLDEIAEFDEESLRRLSVLPGITGLWQVEARDNPSFHAYRRLDLLYVDNWSIGLDCSILIATGPVVIERAIRALGEAFRRRGVERQVP